VVGVGEKRREKRKEKNKEENVLINNNWLAPELR
jgi:hypothetical protein